MVKLVGSYADLIVLGLIMRPVDDRNLYQYLDSIAMDPYLRKKSLVGSLVASSLR